MPKAKWYMAERGKRWCYCLGEKTLAFVVWNFCGWDAYICTEKKWPNHQKLVHYYSPTGSNTCWEARRAIESEIEEACAR